MNPLLFVALLTLHAPAPLPRPLPAEPGVVLRLDRPQLDVRPARATVLPRRGARVLAGRR